MNAGIKIEKKRNQEVFDGFTIFHYNVALCDLYRKGISRNFLGDTFCILDNFYFQLLEKERSWIYMGFVLRRKTQEEKMNIADIQYRLLFNRSCYIYQVLPHSITKHDDRE